MDDLKIPSLFIFLNKTCFNGLYRVNRKNEYNVSFGKIERATICDASVIFDASQLLQKVTILQGDYNNTLNYASENSFYYLDPPYKPVSLTSSFNSYTVNKFADEEQKDLKEFCQQLTAKKSNWLLSNSYTSDKYFEKLYGDEQMFIDMVGAKRSINSNGNKRGNISELLISNYKKLSCKK